MAVEGTAVTDAIARLEKVLRKQFVGELPNLILNESLTAAAQVVVARAKQPDEYFRDDSGKLRRTIKVGKRRGGGRTGGRRGGGSGTVYTGIGIQMGGAGARQGVLIELGTKTAKARAPIRRAIYDTADKQAEVLRSEGDKSIRGYVKELNSKQLRPQTRRALAR